MAWILAKKLEMTRIVKEDKFIPITLLEFPVMKVVDIKTIERDWYEAIVIGILSSKEKTVILKEGKAWLSKKSFIEIREFSVTKWMISNYKVADDISIDVLDSIKTVTVSGISKWKWFAWAMKKHNFHWGPKTHGSKFHRALWSIGNRKPTRTHKWKKMHWHMGAERISLKNVPIELINKEMSVIWLRWSIPGWRNSIISIAFNY